MMPNLPALSVINNSIINNGSSFPKELNKFGIWMFFTNYRSLPGEYFKDAELYPKVNVSELSILNQPVSVDAKTVTNNFLFYVINTSSGPDSLCAVITNGNYFSYLQNPNTIESFSYTLFNSGSTGERELTADYSSNFDVSNESAWSVSEILNRIIAREDSIKQTLLKNSELFIFQNPFYYSTSTNDIVFAFDGSIGEKVSVNIFTIAMKQVFSETKIVTAVAKGSNTFTGIEWDGRNQKNEKLPTGTYLVVVKNGDDVLTGKIAIFNE